MERFTYQKAIIKNIHRQKQKINNSKSYNEQEKKLIMKGLDMAIDRINTAYQDDEFRREVGLPIYPKYPNVKKYT